MTNLQWAVIACIRQCPQYRFLGSERRTAERMVKRGWLKRGNDSQHFTVTKDGETEYRRYK